MSRNRFQMVMCCLPFVNNEEEIDETTHRNPKARRLWPVLQELNRKFLSEYVPEQDVSVDESLLLFKGRLGWQQYMPLKWARLGLKFFLLCNQARVMFATSYCTRAKAQCRKTRKWLWELRLSWYCRSHFSTRAIQWQWTTTTTLQS